MTIYPTETTFAHDQVTEDVASVGYGEVWIYFFKETLIGVRDVRNAKAAFLKVETKNETTTAMSPTLEYLTDAHIREAIDEMRNDGEVVEFFHINELGDIAVAYFAAELNFIMNSKLLGEA